MRSPRSYLPRELSHTTGLVLSHLSCGVGAKKGRARVHFVCAGGVAPPKRGAVMRRGAGSRDWELDWSRFLDYGFRLRCTLNGVVLAMSAACQRTFETGKTWRVTSAGCHILCRVYTQVLFQRVRTLTSGLSSPQSDFLSSGFSR